MQAWENALNIQVAQANLTSLDFVVVLWMFQCNVFTMLDVRAKVGFLGMHATLQLIVTIRPTKPVDSKPTGPVGFGCHITT